MLPLDQSDPLFAFPRHRFLCLILFLFLMLFSFTPLPPTCPQASPACPAHPPSFGRPHFLTLLSLPSGFTSMSKEVSPSQVMAFLNE